jgi:hypothetical protein
MHHRKITVAVATAGAGVICLAPVAQADTPTGSDGAPGVPKVNLGQIVPCVKVGAPGGRVVLEVRPCIKVGAPAAANVIEHNPNIVVRSSDGSSP